MDKIYNCVIVGSGPAGLAAAIYLGREDLKVLVVERALTGGTMAVIPQIDNYPGAPNVAGAELAGKMWAQAESFGVEKITAEVQKIATGSNPVAIIVAGSDPVKAKTVLVAAGGSYRKLGVEGEEFAHYCATCDGPFYKGKKLVVVGGGNSAVSGALFLAKFASEIVIAVRDGVTAEKTLQDEVLQEKKITLKTGMKIKKIVADEKKVVAVEFENETIPADGVFIFAGQVPASGWLAGTDVKLDEQGYVKTDENLMAAPGIFAAGDVRSGNIKQIAVAAGEGVTASKKISEYLKSF